MSWGWVTPVSRGQLWNNFARKIRVTWPNTGFGDRCVFFCCQIFYFFRGEKNWEKTRWKTIRILYTFCVFIKQREGALFFFLQLCLFLVGYFLVKNIDGRPLGVDATGTRFDDLKRQRFKTTTRRRKGKTTRWNAPKIEIYLEIISEMVYYTLPETHIFTLFAPEIWWLGDYWILLGMAQFQGRLLLVPGRVFFLFSWLVRFLPTVILGED